jgi:hypothetical protein
MAAFFSGIFLILVSRAWSELRINFQASALKTGGSMLKDYTAQPGVADYSDAVAGPSDRKCWKGLSDAAKTVCCSPKCWTCGHHPMCDNNTKYFEITGQNNTDCCDDLIKMSKKECDKTIAPCIISASYREKWKADNLLPINVPRHQRNKDVIKQKKFRFDLYNKVKKNYDLGRDKALLVQKLAHEKVVDAETNEKKYSDKLAADGVTHLMKVGVNDAKRSLVVADAAAQGPASHFTWITELENARDEARFYKQIRRNAVWVVNNATNGLARVDVMKVTVQSDLEKINTFDGEMKDLNNHSEAVHAESLLLWKQWMNSAKHFNCTRPVVDHAENICYPNTLSRKCPVECQEGYDSKDSKNTLRCLKTGDFNKELFGQLTGIATCQGRNCGKPPTISKATVVIADVIYPNGGAYLCYEGHSVDGKASGPKAFNVPCGTKGKFMLNNQEHRCLPVRCGKAPVIQNTFPIGGSFVFTNRLSYKCLVGHTTDGSAAAVAQFETTCQASGEFSQPQQCLPVNCGPAPGYANTKSLTSTSGDQFYPKVMKYSCDSGFSLDQKFGGPTEFALQCDPTGEFVLKMDHGAHAGMHIPVCRPVSAGMSPKIDHGDFVAREMFFGEAEVITAVVGFSTIAKADAGLEFTIKVNEKGNYTGVQQFKPVSCGAPPSVANSGHTFTKTEAVFADKLSYDCKAGYSTDATAARARGSFVILCEADGTFSKIPGPTGECVNIDDCLSHTCGPFGHCVDKLQNYSCKCKDGYEETYDNKTDEKVCGNIDDCGPDACGVGECQDGLNDYTCICPEGHEVVPTGEGETCAAVTCGTPPRVEHALTQPVAVGSAKAYYEEAVLYQCGTGYTLDGKATGKNHFTITCGADKSFSATKTCKPIECGAPATLPNTHSLTDTATYGEEVKYECDEGYTIDATPTGDPHFSVKCLVTGNYGLPMECKPIQCGEPDQVANAQRASGKRKFGDVVDYTCFKGYTIDGNRDSKPTFSATCEKTGNFTSLETCNPKVCGEPPKNIHVLYATIPDTGKLHYPQHAEIVCRDGYTIGGDPKGNNSFVVNCNDQGQFDDHNSKSCQPVKCGDLPNLPNATIKKVVDEKTHEEVQSPILTFGLKATYTCAPGFTAGGTMMAPKEVVAECFPSGQFSLPTPDMMCVNVNDCAMHTCGAHGKCVDLVGPAPAYTCKCEFGHELRTRQNGEKFCGNVDNCGSHECGPGTCQDLIGDYTCICPPGHFLGEADDGKGGMEKTCLPVECLKEAPKLTNGKLVSDHSGPVTFGEKGTLRYKCDEGYSVDGSPVEAKKEFQASCMENEEFHGMLTCQAVKCGTPKVMTFTDITFPANARRILAFGEAAKYKCKEGYSVKGMKPPDAKTEFSTKCLATGVLQDPEICEPIKCGRAPRMAKCRANIAGDDVSFGMDVQYECDKGHTQTGTALGDHHFHRKCLADGTFESSDAVCKPVSAGKIPKVPSASLIALAGRHIGEDEEEDFTAVYPQGIEFKCKDGFSLDGAAAGRTKFVTQVNSEGQFVPALPGKCQKIVFSVVGEIKNARTGAGLPGAQVKIVGSTQPITLSDQGFFTLKDVQPGTIRVKYQRRGYIDTVKTIKVEGDVHSGGIADINMSPKMQPTQWRAALKWNENPPDLDTYVKWSTNTMNWANTYVSSGMRAKLEKDDTDGLGPETAYISGVGSCDGGSFKCDIKYMINDYDEGGRMLDTSDAEVVLYNGETVSGTWKISDCASSVSEDGNWWHVFTIDAATNKLKWHCKMGAALIDLAGNSIALSAHQVVPDFERYVGPFPGRYLPHSRNKKAGSRRTAAKIARHNLRANKSPT